MANIKIKKKELSFGNYARAIQADIADLSEAMKGGFVSIRDDMATKDDSRKLRKEIADVRDDISRMNGIMVSKGELAETLRRELDVSPYAKASDIKEVRDQLLRVEEKLGMKPIRHAA